MISPTICQVIAHFRLIEYEDWADLFSHNNKLVQKYYKAILLPSILQNNIKVS